MRQTLKIGFVTLVVAAMAASGIALAQTGGDDAAPEAPDRPSFIMERLAPLVEDGTLTESQAEAVAEVLADGFESRRPHRGPGLEGIGEFLGLTGDEIREALQGGSTLAEIAGANGSSGDELTAFLVADAEERLDEAVAEGRIDETEKDEKLAEIAERIAAMVEGEGPGIGHGPRGPGGPGGPGDGAGFAPGGAPEGVGTGV